MPIGSALLAQLDDYAKQHPATEVTLPWVHPDGKPVTVRLLLVDSAGGVLTPKSFEREAWRPALIGAKISSRTRADGVHALRHLYASVLLDAGESVKALSSYLGHSDPGFTLRVYTHLLPSSHARTRNAVDQFFGSALGCPATGEETKAA